MEIFKIVGKDVLVWLTVISQILILLYVAGIIFRKKGIYQSFTKNLEDRAMLVAFVTSLTAMLGSLFYSDIVGYEPCKFCWYQRIFMYPQVFLLGYAMYKKDLKIIPYSLMLSVIGGLIALNHYILQTTGVSIVPCTAIGTSVSCNKLFVLKLGYITIPLMALSAFVLMILSLWYIRKNNGGDR